MSSVEKAHGSGACVAKDHTYITEILAVRAGLHQVRLRFLPDHYDKMIGRIEKSAAAWRRGCPERITGRHMFFAEKSSTDISNASAEDNLFVALQSTMRRHAEHWENLPLWSKLAYDAKARLGLNTLIISIKIDA